MKAHRDRPPRWAEGGLRLLLPARDRDSVTGDLLEAYREDIRSRRSKLAADWWYLRQVLVFARPSLLVAAVLAALYVGRTALDWFAPPDDFLVRAEVTTWLLMIAPFAAGFILAFRTRSESAGAWGILIALTAGTLLCTIGNALMLSLWHDRETLLAIARSGGVTEVFVLPFLVIVPASIDGWFGAVLGQWVGGLRRSAVRPS